MEPILTQIAFIFHYGVLILFGVFNSAAFIGVWKTRKDTVVLFIVAAMLAFVQIAVLVLKGTLDDVMYVYPLITHVPLIVFFALYYHRTRSNLVAVALGVIIAYFCCQIGNWLGIVASAFGLPEWAVDLVIGVVLLIVWYFLYRYFANTISALITESVRSALILGILPTVYYFYDYISVVYSDLLYTSNKVTVEFLPFILCLSYLAFIFLYFREYAQRLEAERQTQMLRMQTTQYKALQSRIEETRRARHDLRQHLRLIQAYLSSGDEEALKDYIHFYGQTLPEDTGTQFCQNTVADTVVRFYAQKAAKENIQFEANLYLPADMNISEPDLCVLIGNLLENALEECGRHPAETCSVKVRAQLRGSRTLIITVDNTPANAPRHLGDASSLLSSKKSGREGIGMLSIQNIAARYHGDATFEWHDNTFYASIILTLPAAPKQ